MTMTDRERSVHNLSLDAETTQTLADHCIVHDLDRSSHPHLLVKVPDLEKTLEAEVGVEIDREEDGCVTLSVLIYDIPSEPVSYSLRLYPDVPRDLHFLWSFVEKARFRLHPCMQTDDGWVAAPSEAFKLPANVLLRLKHYSLSWPRVEALATPDGPQPEPQIHDAPESAHADARIPRGPDPRDTVIRKLKEQTDALRAQVQERDKRIIDLEDELREIKSKGRSYRLSGEKRPWWKPFS